MKYLGYIVFSVFCQSVSYGYITRSMDSWAVLRFVFLSFLVTSIIYTTVSIRRARRVSINDLGYLILLNVATAMAFVCFYVAIAFVPGSIASLIEAAVGPLWVLIVGRLIFKARLRLQEASVAAAVTVCALLAAKTSNHLESHAELLGLCLAALAGGGAALVALFSRKAASKGLAAEVILAHRFHLTYLIAAGLLTWHGQWLFEPVLNVNGVLVVLIGVIIPMYFLQLGMQSAEPVVTMLCLSLVPVITYAFELAFGDSFRWDTFAFIANGVFISSMYLIAKARRPGAS
ncbi:threonine/homoserine efflux transporter RhtA [Paraburkholderia sp. BL8N3]|jgi:drug/metabolite transporter (DMT)-like permease|nr:EamA family transporter [Paraburkholderia sp. BL8N3]TCK38173.1 threonine/homoserine efflux transporter RhtA [Paraburkholderia sp. BL8N3]